MFINRRNFLAQTGLTTLATVGVSLPALAASASSVVIWNRELLATIAATRTGPTVASRAIAMVHEAGYNAWAAYNPVAAFTVNGVSRQSAGNDSVKSRAISYAAYTVLAALFPTRLTALDGLLASATPTSGNTTADAAIKAIGIAAGKGVLSSRANDGANQLGNLAPTAYSDYTGYAPVNTPDQLIIANRWQPLRVTNASGVTSIQKYLTPHWGRVRPFALASGAQFRPAFDPAGPSTSEINEIIQMTAALDATTKAQAEIWAGGPGTVTPPGLWMQIAESTSARDGNKLDADVKLFFCVSQALLDAGIAAWDAKRAYDSVRPISSIRSRFAGRVIQGWGGPGKGTISMLGENWHPYQDPTFVTPPFAEFVSGHSTFSRAAANAIAGMRRTDAFAFSMTTPARSISWDPTQPASSVTFKFATLQEAAEASGLSRRWGGIHFERGDLAGRQLGQAVGDMVLARCRALFEGRNV